MESDGSTMLFLIMMYHKTNKSLPLDFQDVSSTIEMWCIANNALFVNIIFSCPFTWK